MLLSVCLYIASTTYRTLNVSVGCQYLFSIVERRCPIERVATEAACLVSQSNLFEFHRNHDGIESVSQKWRTYLSLEMTRNHFNASFLKDVTLNYTSVVSKKENCHLVFFSLSLFDRLQYTMTANPIWWRKFAILRERKKYRNFKRIFGRHFVKSPIWNMESSFNFDWIELSWQDEVDTGWNHLTK